jgi:hypothetical protein
MANPTMRIAAPSLIAAALFCATQTAALAATYNAVKQFSFTANPSRYWSYTSNGALLTKAENPCGSVTGLECWSNGGKPPDNAVVGKNITGGTISQGGVVLPKNYLGLDPQAEPNVAVTWLAREAGTYTIKNTFLGIQETTDAHGVAVYHNTTSLFSATISGYGEKKKFKTTITVAKGDTISFQVTYEGGDKDIATGLAASIKSATQ